METSHIRREGEVLYKAMFRLSLQQQEEAKADHLSPSCRTSRGAASTLSTSLKREPPAEQSQNTPAHAES